MKKVLASVLLGASLILSCVPVSSAVAEEKETGSGTDPMELTASYDMSHDGDSLLDISGSGHNAEIVGFSDEDFQQEDGDTALNFSGDSGKYIKLPGDLIKREKFAVEAEFKTDTVANSWLWCLGTKVQTVGTNYVFISPSFGDGSGIRAGIKNQSTEQLFQNIGKLVPNEYNTVRLEFDEGKMSISVNGEIRSTMTSGYSIQEILKNGAEKDCSGYIGKSLYSPDPAFTGTLTRFDVYTFAETDELLLQEDLDCIKIPSEAEGDIDLPEEGKKNGSDIIWTSSDENVISGDGSYHMPEENTSVTLTASATYGDATAEKRFTVTAVGFNGLLQSSGLMVPYTLKQGDRLPDSVADIPVSWSCPEPGIVSADGTIEAPESGMKQDVTLTAIIDYEGRQLRQEYQVQILGKDSMAFLGYTRDGSVDGGLRVGNSLHLAYYESGAYKALNSNYGILFASADYTDSVAGSTRTLKDPYIFRMTDGSFGVIAVRALTDGTSDAPGKILFFTSEDLIQYEEKGLKEIAPGESMSDFCCEYDAVKDCYRIGWTDEDGAEYFCMTEDFDTFTSPEPGKAFDTETVTDTRIANAVPCNMIYVTADEGQKIRNKLSRVVNTSIDDASCTFEEGEEIDLSSVRVKAHYSDGSTADKRVEWNQEQIDSIDTDVPGTYTVAGTVIRSEYPYPMMTARADPNIIYYEGKYYFIATDDKYATQYNIYIRGADTISGLADIQLVSGSDKVDVNDHLLWDGESAQIQDENGNWITNPHQGIHWAPELHVIGDRLYCFFAMRPHNNLGRYEPQCYVARLKEGGDPLKASDWEEPIRMQREDGSPLLNESDGITLDMTWFEVDGTAYVCWSQRLFANGENPGLVIAKADKEHPWKIIGEPVRIAENIFSWERDGCNEGPYVIVNEGTVYMVYSANGVGPQYATGMMTAQEGADLTDPASWTKSNYPWMHNGVLDGQYGLGHNSFFQDEYGDWYNVYHANPASWGGDRNASIVPLHFRADGSPVLDMKPDEEVNPDCREVQAVITVSGSETAEVSEILITLPDKTTYKQGEELDTAGMKVTAVYSDGSKVKLDPDEYTLSGFSSEKTGVIEVTVTYTENGISVTASFEVTIEEGAEEEPGGETPEDPDEKPSEDPDQKPSEDPDQKPSEDPDQKPSEDPDQKPSEDPGQKPLEDPEKKPAQDPERNPADVSGESLKNETGGGQDQESTVNKAVQTGDNMNSIAEMAALMIFSAGTAVILSVKKRGR